MWIPAVPADPISVKNSVSSGHRGAVQSYIFTELYMIRNVLQLGIKDRERTLGSSLSLRCLLLNFLFPEGLLLHSDSSLSW